MSKAYPLRVHSDEFASKRVLVTGGTKGIGREIVRRMEARANRLNALRRKANEPSSSSHAYTDVEFQCSVQHQGMD
jgi:NAD(P)-dependent dehydrogenase (short-subunit alcohol dehydrogenase family)